jgi:glutamyl-Q tRNA(Asp) synthetase
MVTRFAPSPTGYLHLGHVAHALYVWGLGRWLGARILLRIEDHDRKRCRHEYEVALFDDLDWLGFVPDEGPAGPRSSPSPYRQSDTPERYRDALATLRAHAHVYACRCTRRTLAALVRHVDGDEVRYPGICRHARIDEAPGVGLRVELPPGVETFDDLRLGPQVQAPSSQCGDLLARDRDGFWTYQFAVTVDDLSHGVDLVVRGEDLLASTGRQIALARLLGRATPPRFFHHPLIVDGSGAKLSKSNGDTGVRELRAEGWTPGRVLGEAAVAVGLRPGPGTLRVADAADLVCEAHLG